jgi:DNA-binding NarL/FixJ family response regulator
VVGEPGSAPTAAPAPQTELERDRDRQIAAADLLGVDQEPERAGRALALGRVRLAGGLELEAQEVVARRDRALRLHVEAVLRHVVVGVPELAVLHVEREAAVVAPHGEEHPLGAALGDVDLGRDRVGPVQHLGGGVTGHDLGARVVQVLRALGRNLRSLLGELERAPAVDGQDVVLARFRVPHPDQVVFLTMHADAELAAAALRAGASGFVVKRAAGKELIAAIQTVLLGRKYVTPHLAQEVLEMLAEPRAATGRLTPRQRDVIRLLAEGRTMKEIAATLQISPRTVETYKYQALEALGLKTTADLIRYTVEHGLIPRADQA